MHYSLFFLNTDLYLLGWLDLIWALTSISFSDKTLMQETQCINANIFYFFLKTTINPPPTRMLGFNVPQCLFLLFILFILDTILDWLFMCLPLTTWTKDVLFQEGFFLPWQTLKIIIKKTSEYDMIWNVLLWQISKKTCFLSISHNLLERRISDPIQKWEETVLTSAAGAAPQAWIHWSSRERGNGKENHCRALPVLLWCPHAVGGCLLK